MTSGNAELDGFIAKYTPEVAALTHALIAKMRVRLPGATLAAYDNYNALAVGFGPDDSVKHVILSITPYPRWVSLFFMWGATLDDPHGLLQGGGAQVRSVRLESIETLDDPRIEALIADALAKAIVPIDPGAPGDIVIKSVSAKQRPRRPA